MTEGVLYYNRGTRFLARLAVSVRTLRRHYTGDAAVVAEGGLPEWFREVAVKYALKVIELPRAQNYHLVFKAGLWRHTPFERTVFIDADTIIRGSIQPLFDAVRESGFVVTNFNGWVTSGRKMRRRITDWSKIDAKLVENAFRVKYAINTGVFGWVKGHPLLPETEKLSERGFKAKCGRVMLDELAMQLLLPNHKHAVLGKEFNTGAVHGNGAEAVIVHYHGDKHCRDTPNCDFWKQEFNAMLAEDFPHLRQQFTKDSGDRCIELWLRELDGFRRDMTIVTAVTPEYADRYKANFAKWMATPGLREQQFIVFVHGFKNAAEREFVKHPQVKVVRWDYSHAGATRRETVLAAFVLGVAKHVKTDYWMKLDADTWPKRDQWEWPKYRKHTVVSHSWGYTKMKGDPDGAEHWFNRLDRAFTPAHPFFKRKFAPSERKISHRNGNEDRIPMRFASFCHIERTEFTRKIAKVVNERCDGRLPIPSQDTLSWYCTALWKEPVKLINMKEWFSPR